MNKKIKIILLILAVIILVISIVAIKNMILIKKSNEKYGYWVNNSEFLYEKAINYLKEHKDKTNNNEEKEDYQVFYNYESFGIKEKDNKKYAYMYILEQSYYVKKGKLCRDEQSCMPYKFTFENDEVVNYENVENNVENASLIKEMFPDDIENKVLKYNSANMKIIDDVINHYSYLESTVIITEDYDENIIAFCGSYNNNVITGKCINGYGDVYEYNIPFDENKQYIEDINIEMISEYKKDKVFSISEDDFNIIKNNMPNVKNEYSNINSISENKPLFFVKIISIKNPDTLELSYNNDELTDLIIYNLDFSRENTSEASQNIINIFKKYNLIPNI